jgi:hypothetical protein
MTRWRTLSSTSALATVLIGASLGLIPMQQLPKATAATVEGFGSMTKGGSRQPVYHVTYLQDHGIGSLRDAVAKGYRFIRHEPSA